MNNEKIIIIGGGVGPLAGTLLHNYIIENTITDGTDQDHFDIYHFSRSSDIPDRTSSIENGSSDKPALGMYRTFQTAAAALKISKKAAVGGVPCNTFHAPVIFNSFLKYMENIEHPIKIMNMIDETIKDILSEIPGVKNIGLLSTTGTRNTGVYSNQIKNRGVEVMEVSRDIQTELHNSIYNKNWGLKAVTPASDQARANFEKYADYLLDRGAELIILGCTEIPLALPYKKYKNIPLIDPMISLARSLIREANINKLKTT